jgi:RNase adaptor protein for sRNA GlmZ degradation
VNSYFRKPSDFSHFIKVLNAIFEYWLLTERTDGEHKSTTAIGRESPHHKKVEYPT